MKDFKDPLKQLQETKIKKNRAKTAQDLEDLIEGGVLNPQMSLTEVIFILKDQA